MCQNDCNLLASCGESATVKVYDRRVSKVVKTIEDGRPSGTYIISPIFILYYIGWLYCVRWDWTGEMLAVASEDQTAKVIDFGSGKSLFTDTTKDGSNSFHLTIVFIKIFDNLDPTMSVCFV